MKHLIVVLSAFAIFAVSCSQPKELVYKDTRNFRVHKLGFGTSTLVMDLQYYNPNNFGLQLKDGDVDVYLNSSYLGKGRLDERTAVPAQDTFLVPVSVDVDMSRIFSNALTLLSQKDVDVKLEGTVKVGKGGVFVKLPIRYVGKQRIEIK